MSPASASPRPAPAWRPGVLHVQARRDLQVVPQVYEGQTYYVVKNPASRKYFRLRPEAYFVLRQLDGTRTPEEIAEAFERAFPTQHIETSDLNVFIEELRQSRFLHMPTAEGVDELYRDYGKRHLRQAKQIIANFLFLRIPLVDPDRLLERLLPYVRWAFRRWFRVLAAAVILAALALVIVQYDTFKRRLPHMHDLLTWRHLLYFWLALAFSKVLHEFGHGLACKYYGGEVHEMGLLFLVLTPCLYCNVSDAWMIRSKRHKIIITLAGIAVEVFLASVATFLWWYSQPGFLNTLALTIMIVCSVSTVIFNGNPLLRYDGYYALADWLEIPNLRTKSNWAIWNTLGKLCAGIEIPHPHMPRGHRVLFGVYAVASYLYRWIVMLSIVMFMYTFLKPYKLAVLSVALGVMSSATLFLLPIYRGVVMLWNRRSTLHVDYRRVAATALVLAGLAAVLFWLPLPFRVGSTLLLRPRNAKVVYVETPGVLTHLSVHDGQAVQAGQELAVLTNRDKEIQLTRLQGALRELEALADAYRAAGRIAAAKQAEEAIQEKRQAIRDRTEELALLRLRAPRAGIVMISGDSQELLGRYFSHGDPLGVIADPADLEAMLVIEQESVLDVAVGAAATLQLYSQPQARLRGTVRQVSAAQIDELPRSMTQAAAGEVPARMDQETGQARPLHPSYVILVDFDAAGVRVWPGLRGYARIDGGTMTLAGRARRWLEQTFNFKLRL